MTTGAFDADIVIATRDRSELLRRTLSSLAATSPPSAVKRVLVLENGGGRGAGAVVEEFADRLPVHHEALDWTGKSRTLNRALELATADLIVFFDDDVRVGAPTVAAYVDAAKRYGRSHHFAGPLIAEWEEEPPQWLKSYLPPSAVGWDQGDEEVFYDHPHFIGSNWAAFRADMLAVGGFDERIGPGSPTGTIGDEMELQRRLLDAGGRGVYLPQARAWHHVPAVSCGFDWARRRQFRGGLTNGFLGWEPEGEAVQPGSVGHLKLAIRSTKIRIARILGWTEERRAWLEMTHARARGYREGRRLSRRYGASTSSAAR